MTSVVGLNKDFRKMINENASLKTLTVKDVLTASDGTRKVCIEPQSLILIFFRFPLLSLSSI